MSILETMLTLSIMSLLALSCFSSYAYYYQHQEVEAAAIQLVNALEFSKQTSEIQGKTIYLCSSTDMHNCNTTWQGELFIFNDNQKGINGIIKKSSPLPPNVQVSFSGLKNPPLYFMSNGETANNGTFTITRDHQQFIFTLSATGIVRRVS